MSGDIQRRRSWTTAEKVRLVEETMLPGMSVSYVAHRAGIPPSQLFAWKRRILEGGTPSTDTDDNLADAAARVRELEKRVHELERILGRKIMEIENLKASLDRATSQRPVFLPAMCKDDGSR